MHQRPALELREHGRVDLLGDLRIIGQHHAAARSAQGLVGGRGGDVAIVQRVRMNPARHQPGEMRHIAMEPGTDRISNLAEPLEVDLAWDRRTTGDDQLRLVLGRQFRHLVIVDIIVGAGHAILHRIEPFARLIDLGAVGQVAA